MVFLPASTPVDAGIVANREGAIMNDLNQLLAGPLGIVIGLLLIVWAILMFFAPFFWYGTWKQAKDISRKLDSLEKD